VSILLADAVWPQVPARPLVLVPLGSLEQHGPHLPLDTDAAIADAVARRAAGLLEEAGAWRPVTVAPVVAYGARGKHQGVPRQLFAGQRGAVRGLVHLIRSIHSWADQVEVQRLGVLTSRVVGNDARPKPARRADDACSAAPAREGSRHVRQGAGGEPG
jgi:hypothetical protein